MKAVRVRPHVRRREGVSRPCVIPVSKRDPVQVEHLRKINEAVIRGEPEQQKLYDRLLDIGGWEVVLWKHEPDLDAILTRGETLSGREAILRRGAPISCHANTAEIWYRDPKNISIMTGYTLDKDGLWRQHSWAFDKRNGKVIETTAMRVLYFGFALTDAEAQQFHEENW